MKSITRFIGAVVLIVVLAGFVLFKLNERGFLSGNLSTLDSIEGQYLGPIPSIFPLYIGERDILSRMTFFVFSLVQLT